MGVDWRSDSSAWYGGDHDDEWHTGVDKDDEEEHYAAEADDDEWRDWSGKGKQYTYSWEEHYGGKPEKGKGKPEKSKGKPKGKCTPGTTPIGAAVAPRARSSPYAVAPSIKSKGAWDKGSGIKGSPGKPSGKPEKSKGNAKGKGDDSSIGKAAASAPQSRACSPARSLLGWCHTKPPRHFQDGLARCRQPLRPLRVQPLGHGHPALGEGTPVVDQEQLWYDDKGDVPRPYWLITKYSHAHKKLDLHCALCNRQWVRGHWEHPSHSYKATHLDECISEAECIQWSEQEEALAEQDLQKEQALIHAAQAAAAAAAAAPGESAGDHAHQLAAAQLAAAQPAAAAAAAPDGLQQQQHHGDIWTVVGDLCVLVHNMDMYLSNLSSWFSSQDAQDDADLDDASAPLPLP